MDGVCCESACAGGCLACSAAKTAQADGLCRAIVGGTDPDSECTQDSALSCGLDGTCDGAGACRRYVAGSTCVPASCSGSTFTSAQTCNGAGTCQAPTTGSCGAYVCGATSCLTTCATSADCAVKDVGNCCGYFPACVNRDSPVFPEQVRAACEAEGRASICGFREITSCECVAGQCQAAGGGASAAQ